MLTTERLERFEAALRRAGAPVVDYAEPGLTPDQARALTVPFKKIELPQELLTWFGWHNGATRGSLSLNRMWLSLQEALEEYEDLQEAGADPEYLSLLPITTGSPTILVECVPGSPTLGRIFLERSPEDPAPKLGSVGELIEVWISYLDCGAWRYVGGVPEYGTEVIESRLNPIDGAYV